MKLHPDWKRILRKAWSIRLVALSGLLGGCEVIVPLFADAMPRNVFAGLSMLAAVAGALARVVDQPQMERRSTPRPRPDHAKGDFND